MPTARALLVSRDTAVLKTLTELNAVAEHLAVSVCPSAEEACLRIQDEDFALVLVHLPAGQENEVTRLLRAVAGARRLCATVVLTDNFSEEQALPLLRAGAVDCLQVPRDLGKLPRLLALLSRRLPVAAQTGEIEPGQPAPLPAAPVPLPGRTAASAKSRRAPSATAVPPEGDEADQIFDGMSAEMRPLLEQVRRVAPQETTLLLTGQTGTGKTRLARLVHELSPRRHEPFLVIDCGALSPTLIESELFGHVKGAFTGAERERAGKLAAAGRGTLLLDEVNSLPLALQAKLLRAVDDRLFEPVGGNRPQPLQARLIAASNADLQAEVAQGRFREDLYYRLNVVAFFLPPLRERRSAIAPMALRFLAEFASRNRPEVTGISVEALRALEAYPWPGNVRELRNVIERAVALCPGPEVQRDDLPELIQLGTGRGPLPALPASEAANGSVPGSAAPTLAQSKQEAEVRRILETLERTGNNRLRAAAELGISRMALYKKLHKYGLMGE
jgi:DNA-binding NtrC family response regulator